MIKKLIILIAVYTIFAQISYANNYMEKTVWGYNFRVIKYDINSQDYIFKIGVNKDYEATTLRELMEENNWVSAINWVFFCPSTYKECWGKNFTRNERYVEGEKVKNIELSNDAGTWDRVVFAIDNENTPFLFQTNKINPASEDQIYYWFWNFPLLLQSWVSKFEEYEKLGLIDDKMKAKMQRNFICSDKLWKYIYTWYISSIKLQDLPDILLKFGCYNALNLDAWWSSALIYNSRYIIWPGRDVMDWVIIERKWLDTKKIIENAKKIIETLEKRNSKKTEEEKIEYYNNLSKWLWNIKSSMYQKYSMDLVDLETWDKIWYEINIKKLETLKTLYMINYLSKLFYELTLDYKEKIIERDEKIKQEKQKESYENWLF